MTNLAASPLGHATTYSEQYDASLLFAVERAPLRDRIGVGSPLPFHGEDVWTAYELSWLEPSGKPQIAIATLRVPSDSPCIVESKSVKLYLTAFNQTMFGGAADVQTTIARDVSAAVQAPVAVELALPDAFARLPRAEPVGICLDDLALEAHDDAPATQALHVHDSLVRETLFTRLFRSLCPVTAQPDYATVVVRYAGRAIARDGLLRYLVSFRRQPGFHEHCVETIFVDLMRHCAPDELTVYARFTRRGGIDINPYRSSIALVPPVNARTANQ